MTQYPSQSVVFCYASAHKIILIPASSLCFAVGEVKDVSCKLETARRSLNEEAARLQAKIDRIHTAERRLAMQVQDALEDPTNSDPFGPEPEEIELPRTPTKAATPPKHLDLWVGRHDGKEMRLGEDVGFDKWIPYATASHESIIVRIP